MLIYTWLHPPHPHKHTVLWCCSVQSSAACACACGIITGERNRWHNISLLYSAPGISTQLQFPVFQIMLRHHFKLPLLHTNAHISAERHTTRTRVLRWHHCIFAIPSNTCGQTYKQWHHGFHHWPGFHTEKTTYNHKAVRMFHHYRFRRAVKTTQNQKDRNIARNRKTEIIFVF